MCLGVPLEGLVCELRRLLDEGEVELLYIRCVAELDLVVYCASHEDFAHGPQANGVKAKSSEGVAGSVGAGDIVREPPQPTAVNIMLPVIRSVAADDALEWGFDRGEPSGGAPLS